MKKHSNNKAKLILSVTVSIVFIITTVLVLILGLYLKMEGYEIVLTLSPMIIGSAVGAGLLKSYAEE